MADGFGRLSPLLVVFGGLAGLELLVRALAEFLAALDAIAIPVITYIGLQLASGFETLGWVLGWLLLGAAVFETVPAAFPRQLLRWANGLAARTGLAAAAVLFGTYFEQLAAVVVPAFDTSPLPLSLWLLPLTPVAILGVFGLTRVLPVVTPPLPGVTYIGLQRTSDGVRVDPDHPQVVGREIDRGFLFSRWLLVVVFGGFVLATVALAFPVPEVVLLGAITWEAAGRPLDTGSTVPARKDLAERFIATLGIIWSGPRGVLALWYSVVPITAVTFLDVLYMTNFADTGAVLTDPAALVFLLATLGVGTVGVLAASLALAERTAAEFRAVEAEAIETLDEATCRELHAARPLIPGLMVLPAALFVLYESVRSHPPAEPPLPYELLVGPVALVAALGLASACLITLRRPGRLPSLGRRVPAYALAPVSTIVFTAITYGYLIGVNDPASAGQPFGLTMSGQMVGQVPPPLVPTALFAYVVVLAGTAPITGYELFRDPDPTASTAARLKAELKTAGKATIGVVILAAVVGIPLGLLGFGAAAVVLGYTMYLPCIYGVVSRVVLLPFYLVGEWLP